MQCCGLAWGRGNQSMYSSGSESTNGFMNMLIGNPIRFSVHILFRIVIDALGFLSKQSLISSLVKMYFHMLVRRLASPFSTRSHPRVDRI